jgi:hypothetical protein
MTRTIPPKVVFAPKFLTAKFYLIKQVLVSFFTIGIGSEFHHLLFGTQDRISLYLEQKRQGFLFSIQMCPFNSYRNKNPTLLITGYSAVWL